MVCDVPVVVRPILVDSLCADLGCYIDKHGVPTRQCGYIKWETKVVSYANRNGHVLLFSPGFIEIRNSTTGRIVQVIEGQDIRLMYSGPYTKKENPILVAMRGNKDDHNGQSEKDYGVAGNGRDQSGLAY
jgi:hypothetical protein